MCIEQNFKNVIILIFNKEIAEMSSFEEKYEALKIESRHHKDIMAAEMDEQYDRLKDEKEKIELERNMIQKNLKLISKKF